MIVEVKYTLDRINEYGLTHNYFVIDDLVNEKFLITELINGEMWFNCYTNSLGDWEFSSRDIKECLDFLNILYYD